jgi:hypothetical protein
VFYSFNDAPRSKLAQDQFSLPLEPCGHPYFRAHYCAALQYVLRYQKLKIFQRRLIQDQASLRVADPRCQRNSVARPEVHKHAPDWLTVERLAAVLNVPVAYFYATDDDAAELLLAFYALAPDARGRALELIKTMS